MEKPASHASPPAEDFEEFVAAALKVDPKGLSGKHRKEGQQPHPGQTTGSKPS